MHTTKKILIGVLLFTLINLLSSKFFTRFDFTEGQIYTLSPATGKIISKLPDNIEIKAFVSEKLPAQFVTTQTQLKDKLSEYQNLSKGKINVIYTDPVNDKNAETLAQALQIPSLDLQVVDKDQMQVVKAYFGLAILKQKKDATENASDPLAKYESKEMIPVVQDMNNLEYELSSILLKIGSTEQKSIALLAGHGEHGIASSSNQYSQQSAQDARNDYALNEMLGRNYSIKTVNFSEAKDNQNLLEGISTLVIAGPRQSFTDDEVGKVLDFIKKGGNGIFLFDRMIVNPQSGLTASSSQDDYQKILSNWGIEIQPKILADVSAGTASFNQGYMTYSLAYPPFAKITNTDQNNTITRGIQSFILPWSSPLTINKKDDVKTEILAYSSKNYNLLSEQEVTAAAQPENSAEVKKQLQPIDLNPQQDFGLTRQDKNPVPMIVMAQKNGEGKVIIAGNSDFVSANSAGANKENQILFQNMVDSLTLGDDLISIRSKGATDRPLKAIDESQKATIKWGLTIGVPLLFVLYGFYRRSVRNAKKNSLLM